MACDMYFFISANKSTGQGIQCLQYARLYSQDIKAKKKSFVTSFGLGVLRDFHSVCATACILLGILV